MTQVAYSRGISGYINDCCVDLAADAALRPTTVPLFGWLAYYDHYWSRRLSRSAGYSEASQRNAAGQFYNAFHVGRYASLNLWT